MDHTRELQTIRLRLAKMRAVGGGAWSTEAARQKTLWLRRAREDGLRSGALAWQASPRAILGTLRPKQWIKNALVIAAAGAAGALGHDETWLRVGLAFVAFCLIASGIYAINDVRDAPEDRLHPRKRHRPVAAGELDPRLALLLGAGLIVSGLALCTAVRPLLGLVALAYVVLTVSYTLVLRRIPILDIAAIAGGFVLRAVAGGVAAPVALSKWFVLVVTAAAVLVAAGKRQAELRRTEQAGGAARAVLARYGPERLRLIIAGSAAVALFAYGVWAFAVPDLDNMIWRPLTIIPFAVGLLRYGTLIRSGGGEAPEELLLSDRWLQAAGVVWLALFALSVHVTG
jgi:decaprenyl-phosphate phosphoribosyltransferase